MEGQREGANVTAAHQDVKVVILREVEIEVCVRVHAGCPERGPSYDCGGTPAEAASAEVLGFVVLSNGFADALTEEEEAEAEQKALEEQDELEDSYEELCREYGNEDDL